MSKQHPVCAYALALARSRRLIDQAPGWNVEIDTETGRADFTRWGDERPSASLNLPAHALASYRSHAP